MLRVRGWMVLFALGLWLVPSFSAAQTPPRRPHKISQKPVPLPALPGGPLSQVPMDQLPAAPPSVSYQDGLLTIVAQNSTLADILMNVHRLTGASIDVPANATERVVTRLGPGPAREVLASLLNGTSFNYVMVGSPSDPAALSALVLTTRSAGGTDAAAANTSIAMASQPTPAFMPPQPLPLPVVAQPANPAGPADKAEPDTNDDEQDSEEADAAEDQAPGQQPGPTPEQLQQMRQNLKPPPGFQPPLTGPPPHN